MHQIILNVGNTFFGPFASKDEANTFANTILVTADRGFYVLVNPADVPSDLNVYSTIDALKRRRLAGLEE